MQIGKSRTTEELWRFKRPRIKIQEASKDLQMGGIFFPKYRGKLFEDEDLKTTENQRLRQEETHNAPRAFTMRLGNARKMHYAPRACKKSRLEQFKRKATLELWESFYLLLDFLGYIFIYSNLFLVTMCY